MGKKAIVDDSDYENLSSYKWYAKEGYNGVWYAARTSRITGKTKTVRMHREILCPPPDKLIDHCNLSTNPTKHRPSYKV